MVCQQVTSLDGLPATPIDAPVQTYHPMRHYLHCVRQTIDVVQEPAAHEHNMDGALATLRLPDQPQSSRVKVYDDRIVLSLVMDAPLAAYIVTRVSYRLNNANAIPSSHSYERALVHGPVTMTIVQELRGDGTQTVPQILETLHAMRTSLAIRDCFGHTMAVRVADGDVELAELRDLGMSSTFASLRRAMIVAFADQMAHVQRIKLAETDAISQDDRRANRQAAGRLSGRARCLSSTLDALVANAVPRLVVARLPRALWLVKKLWDGDDDSQAPGPQVDATRFDETDISVRAGQIASLIPVDAGCSTGVRAKLLAMLHDFDNANRTHLQPRQLKQEVPLQTRLSDVDRTLGRRPFARTLETYGDRLYSRSSNTATAIDEARTQSQEVMDVMRVCHAIILTQLDAPFDCFVRQTDFFPAGPFAAGVAPTYYAGLWSWTRLASFAGSSTFYSALAGIGGFYIGMVVLVVTAMVVEHAIDSIHSMRARRKRIEVDYDKALTCTRQAFHLTSQPFDSIRETAIAERLQADLSIANEGYTILKWKNAITAGFAGLGDKSPISLYFYTIGDFWVKWLFDVARVSQLRTALASHVYIGVEGPTEAGKSELLTMLTGAPPGVFASGSDEEHRTTEIQSWISPNRRAIFCDFPGSDDRDGELRDVARLCREMLDIVIFVVPCAGSRAAGRVPVLDEITAFIRARTLDLRPFVILVNKVDALDYHRSNPQRFTRSVAERRADVVTQLQDRLGVDVVIHSHRASTVNVGPHPTLIHIGRSSLDDVVLAYSSHAQRSYDEPRALSDCPPETDFRIQEAAKQHHLYTLAQAGAVADVESIRQWLRALSPGCVPEVGRGRQSKVLHGP
ncbi:hypothetical protein FA10DRAFT_268911 [Acaromyces ingoldii]|uniref:G domain-containing protein n=1 Tax=Acaromyces ingoldii TaxID=215250 RepID=A0A316YJH6_9BASI|nr:hypothetical protein FA10DRAFT_268911 [Acaromyces ingoldii]PWN88768.1 hypothetical protein FA10DRAFT_268911 [Acaromyces ingoldii]